MAKKLSKMVVRKAIEGSGGVLLAVSKKLSCCYSTLHKFMSYPENIELNALLLDEREKVIDLAESKLYKKVQQEDWNAIKFTLQTIGSKRGFQDKQEIQHFGSEGINITFDGKKVIDVKPENDDGRISDRHTADDQAETLLE